MRLTALQGPNLLRIASAACVAAVAMSAAPEHSAESNDATQVSALKAESPPGTVGTGPEQRVPHPVVYLRDRLDNMIGQMIMVGFHGRTPSQSTVKATTKLIRDGTIGGIILMSRNVKSKTQLKQLTTAFRAARGGLPPFIAIDQEGGTVQRLHKRRGFLYTPSAARIVRRKSLEEASDIYGKLARQLADVGINMNFGPVVDLAINKRNPIITRRGRSYGDDPENVSQFAATFILAHRENGVLSVAKHFPGHGSSSKDSHRHFVDLSETWKPHELEPYRILTNASAPDLVMVGHLYHPKYGGDEKLPASLSKIAIEEELRDGLKFGGLVVTDDLEMRSVSKQFDRRELTVRAVEAGNDIILFSNPTYAEHTPEQVHAYVREAVDQGRITRDRIAASFKRIVAVKDALRRRARELAQR